MFAALSAALRTLRAHKLRFAMPAFAVLLGVAFVSGSLLYSESVSAAMSRAQTGSQPDVSVEVRSVPSSSDRPARLDQRLLHRLAALPGAEAARGNLEGSSFVVGPRGTLVGSLADSRGVNYVPTRAGSPGEDPRYPLSEGRGPRTAGEIALDRRSAEHAGWRVGDRGPVVLDGTVRRVRLVGVFTVRDARVASGGTLTAYDNATAVRQFAPDRAGYATITLTAARGTSETALARRAEKLLPPTLHAVTRAQLDAEAAESPDSRKLTTLLLGFAGVALLASTFLVANTFTMLSAARAREHALLRAIGATRGQVMRRVLAEAVLVGTFAAAVGYLLGIGVAAAIGSLFGTEVSAHGPLEPLAATPLLASFAVGVGVTTLSAYVPARRSASVSPVAALRTAQPPAVASLRRRGIVGASVTACGALLVLAAIHEVDLFSVAVPVLLLGLIILTPLTALGVTRVLRTPVRRLAGFRGALALANARRNPRRTAATATTLMIGLTLVSAITVVVASLRHVAEEDARNAMISDLRVTAVDFADIGSDTADRIARIPEAAAVTPVAQTSVRLHRHGTLQVTGVDAGAVGRIAGLTVRQGSLDRLDHGIAVTQATADAHGWRVGSRVSGAFTGGRALTELPVVAVYDGPEELTPVLADNRSLTPPGAGGGSASRTRIDSVLVKADPGRTSTLKHKIRAALGNPALLVQDRADAEAEATRPYASMLGIMYAMLSVAVLIGALGVVNTMGMAVFERVREIGLLRAIGLDRRQVGAVLRLEAVLISLLGSGLGLLAGGAVGAAAVAGQEGATVVLPWARLAAFFAASAFIGVLASLWPGRQAARVPMMRALHADTE